MPDLVSSQFLALWKQTKKLFETSLQNTEVITNIKNLFIRIYIFTSLPNKNDKTRAHINILVFPKEVTYGKALLLLRRKLW